MRKVDGSPILEGPLSYIVDTVGNISYSPVSVDNCGNMNVPGTLTIDGAPYVPGGSVTNPLTADLSANGHNITGVATLSSSTTNTSNLIISGTGLNNATLNFPTLTPTQLTLSVTNASETITPLIFEDFAIPIGNLRARVQQLRIIPSGDANTGRLFITSAGQSYFFDVYGETFENNIVGHFSFICNTIKIFDVDPDPVSTSISFLTDSNF